MTTVLSHTVVRWSLPILTLAWVAFLFWVSTYDRGVEVVGVSTGFPNPGPWALVHAGAFGLLAALIALSIWAAWPRLAVLLVPLAASFVATAAYGAGLELYQTTLSTRAGAWGDVVFDATGAAAALAVLAALRRWQGSRART